VLSYEVLDGATEPETMRHPIRLMHAEWSVDADMIKGALQAAVKS
jgi:hypothetical protein